MCRESDASIAVMVFLSPRTHIPMDLSIKVMFAINSLCRGTGCLLLVFSQQALYRQWKIWTVR